ncbi:hypothetical protein N9B45_02810, partial [bacterium]|nr:hypothetical protein [bacterium]
KVLGKQLATAKADLAKMSISEGTSRKVDKKTILADSLNGLVLDVTMAQLTGSWKESTFSKQFVNQYYLHDDNSGKGKKKAVFLQSTQT